MEKIHCSTRKNIPSKIAMVCPIFIHQILLHLGLEEFPASEPIHIIAPIGATFLRQRAAQMRASSKRPRVKSSSSVTPPPLSSTCDPSAKAYVDLTAAVAPPPSTSDDSNICCMLETVMTVQAAHGQLLVDVLAKLQFLQADLASLRRSPPFDDKRLPFGNLLQKRGVHLDRRFC